MAESLKPASSQLREQTAAAHRVLDSSPLLSALLSPELSLASYVKILSIFYDFYCDYESILLETCADLRFDACARQKLPLLEKDARALGVSFDRSHTDFPSLNLDSKAKVLGMIYVVEGSTLGGRVIAKHLAKKLGLNAMNGAAYFHNYGSAVASRWLETQALLNDFQANGGSVATMIATANLIFADLQSRLRARE